MATVTDYLQSIALAAVELQDGHALTDDDLRVLREIDDTLAEMVDAT